MTSRNSLFRAVYYSLALIALLFPAALVCRAATPRKPDVIVFTNGDRLTGTFVREIGGTVEFHSDIAGNLSVPWSKIKELRTHTRMVVLPKGVALKHGAMPANLPVGNIAVADGKITVQSPASSAMIQPIPVANAQYIISETTLRKQLFGRPGLRQGWNGTATAGLTLVQATQNQYSFSAGLGLVRTVPTASWLSPRNRTSVDLAESYGKITQPAYTDSTGTFVPATYTKSSILHVDAERDEYLSPRIYYLGTLSFDHNYSQSLNLQQIYGGGIGYTVIKSPKQELDVKAVAQYERQAFFNVAPPNPSSQDLIGSTFGGNYERHFSKGVVFTQNLLYIPAWNNTHDYSFNETDSLSLPVYKNFSFSVGSLDSYLNDVPVTFPPTRRNSFQLTVGVTYNIKSKY